MVEPQRHRDPEKNKDLDGGTLKMPQIHKRFFQEFIRDAVGGFQVESFDRDRGRVLVLRSEAGGLREEAGFLGWKIVSQMIRSSLSVLGGSPWKFHQWSPVKVKPLLPPLTAPSIFLNPCNQTI